MKVTVIGTGYVGLVSGACLAEVGNDVVCLDVDKDKIRALKDGKLPIYEPCLPEIVERNVAASRLKFSTDIKKGVDHGSFQFIAVGTQSDEDGSADLKSVLSAAKNIGKYMTDYKVVVGKSTVPVGTADKVRDVINQELAKRKVDIPFSVVSNPEFLKEGAAVEDFMRPDRIIIGTEDEQAISYMRALYAPFQRNRERLINMDIRSAELTKYAANAMLATRISFMNEIANLAEKLGADIELVREGIGSDPRIGYHFLYAGAGYGGSCFPKDVKALIRTGEEVNQPLNVLQAVDVTNTLQRGILTKKINSRYGGELAGKTFALWGLAFKPGTNDMREAPSRVVINDLIASGARIKAYDPVATDEAKRIFQDEDGIEFCTRPMEALEGAEALVIMTEWKEFRSPDFDAIKDMMKQPVIFDGRNMYEPGILAQCGIEYHAVGRRC